MAEGAVRSAKELLEKCHRDQSDIFLALLHTRNTTNDEIPLPAQRLMSRPLRSTIPITGVRLKPSVQINVYKILVKRRQQNKTQYDTSANNIPELHQGDTVRLQTSKGVDKIGRIEEPISDPRIYNVISKVVRYRRNRRQLLKVSEAYNNNDDDVLYHYDTLVTNENVNQNPVNLYMGYSRFGRVYKANP